MSCDSCTCIYLHTLLSSYGFWKQGPTGEVVGTASGVVSGILGRSDAPPDGGSCSELFPCKPGTIDKMKLNVFNSYSASHNN